MRKKRSATKKVTKSTTKFLELIEKYQEKVVEFCLTRACAGIFLDPGMGKSAIILLVFRILKRRKLVHTLLIIAQNSVMDTTWNPEEPESELNKWDEFKKFKAIKLHGSKKSKLIHEEADIFIMTPDGLKWFMQELKKDRSLKTKFDMLCVDESTKFKNHRKKTPNNTPTRFGRIIQLLGMFKRRYIMTGTPTSNHLHHLFSQIYILDEGRALGRYITHFRHTYMIPGKEVYQWYPKPGAEDLIYERLKHTVIRMDREDYMKMSPIIYDNKVFDLPPKVRKIYDELEEDLIAQIENDTIVARSAGTATMKLRQVANGGIYMKKGGKDPRELHLLKAELAKELVEELNGKPAMVMFEFDHDLDRLRKVFGKNTPYVAGGNKRSHSIAEIQRRWNRGEMPVLLAQMTTVSHGINLQAGGRAIIWHSNTYDQEIYIQVRDRIWRKGQTKKVFIYHIMARNTVDFIMAANRKRKRNAEQNLLKLFKENYLKKRKAA